MPNQRAAHLVEISPYIDEADRPLFYEACYALDMSGNEFIVRCVRALIDQHLTGQRAESLTVSLAHGEDETERPRDGLALMAKYLANQTAVMRRQRRLEREAKRKADASRLRTRG